MLKNCILVIYVILSLNFVKAEDRIFRDCHYWSGDIYYYTNCVEYNFRNIATRLQNNGITVFMGYCYNGLGNDLTFSYINCVNNNFGGLSMKVPGFYNWYCFNQGLGVSYSFENCVNSNFSNLDHLI